MCVCVCVCVCVCACACVYACGAERTGAVGAGVSRAAGYSLDTWPAAGIQAIHVKAATWHGCALLLRVLQAWPRRCSCVPKSHARAN